MAINIVKEIIDNSFKNNKVSHAYVVSSLTSPTIADYLVKKIVNTNDSIENHSNVFIIDARGATITKELIKNYLIEFSQRSNQNRVLFIKNIDNASKQALNALLKLIEEPAENIYIVMTTENYLRVLPTILSRSQLLLDMQITDTDMSATSEFSLLFKRVFRMKSLWEEQDTEALIKIARKLSGALEQAPANKTFLYSTLDEVIKKENIDIIVKMLIEFYNDIWRLEEGVTISYEEYSSTIVLYQSINFNYKEAITILNKVLNDNKKSLNFKLYKHNLLIMIGGLYE